MPLQKLLRAAAELGWRRVHAPDEQSVNTAADDNQLRLCAGLSQRPMHPPRLTDMDDAVRVAVDEQERR